MRSAAESANLSILIVDADRQTREALSVYFRILGCAASAAVRIARSAEPGLGHPR